MLEFCKGGLMLSVLLVAACAKPASQQERNVEKSSETVVAQKEHPEGDRGVCRCPYCSCTQTGPVPGVKCFCDKKRCEKYGCACGMWKEKKEKADEVKANCCDTVCKCKTSKEGEK